MLKKNAIKNAIGRSSKLKIVEFMRAKRFSRLTQFSSSIETDKVSIFNKIIDTDKSASALNPKKFNEKEKFHKYAERNFFGQFN